MTLRQTVTATNLQVPVAQYPYDNTTVGPAPRVRTILNKTDDFEQAGVRYRSFDAARQVGDLTVYCGSCIALPMISHQHTAQDLASTCGTHSRAHAMTALTAVL